MIRWTGLLGIALLGLAACQQVTGPEFILDFTTRNVRDVRQPDTTIIAEGGEGIIVIEGYFVSPCMDEHLEASALQNGQTIVLEVKSVAPGDDCPTAVIPWRYEARLQSVPSGSYTVRIVHANEADRSERDVTVLEREVTVR